MLRSVDRRLPNVVNDELKEVGEPIAADVRERLTEFRGMKTHRIRPVVLTGRLVVRQTAGKTTGKRPDFGRTQMRKGFTPALQDWEPRVPALVERALDRMVEAA